MTHATPAILLLLTVVAMILVLLGTFAAMAKVVGYVCRLFGGYDPDLDILWQLKQMAEDKNEYE